MWSFMIPRVQDELVQLLQFFTNRRLSREAGQLINQLKDSRPQLVRLRNQLIRLRRQKQLKQQQVNNLRQTLAGKERNLNQRQNDIRNFKKQLENQKAVNEGLVNDIQLLNVEARKTAQQWENQKTISRCLRTTIEDQKGELHKILEFLDIQKAINNEMSQEIERLKAQTGRILSMNRYESLFTGDVLDQSNQCKEYLTNILQQKTGLRISKTKLIYRFDRFSKSNFHQYFDHKEQIVLIIRTIDDFIFGGWSEGGFIPKKKSDKSGLLFSLTNKQCFELSQPNRKAITYDEFNIIFGNSEIAIQSWKDEVFSNFGIKNGFYNCRDYTVDLMLGAGEAKEVKIKCYEMFQLSFQK